MVDKRERILALFDRFDSKYFNAKNRFLRSATWLAGANDTTGAISEAEVGRHAEVASGGAGTVITGMAYVSEEGKGLRKQWGIHNDDRIADVKALADVTHRAGSRLIVQLCHAGGQRAPESVNGTRSISPSGLIHPSYSVTTEEITHEDILDIRAAYAAAALRAKEGGADGVEVHGGHGFLLMQFLSPTINRRRDIYGGTLENRMRIFREILKDIRVAVGENFPIWYKLSMAEGTEEGYKSADGLKTASTLLADGACGIEISHGAPYSGARNLPTVVGVSAGESEAPFRAFASELKRSSSPDKVIILTGGLRSLEAMADLLRNGTCDIFGISRPFIAEPDLINRWYEEDARPAACISCNACFTTAKHGIITCPVLRDKNEGTWDPL